MFCHMKEVYFTAWPFSKLQVLHWPVARALYYSHVPFGNAPLCQRQFKGLHRLAHRGGPARLHVSGRVRSRRFSGAAKRSLRRGSACCGMAVSIPSASPPAISKGLSIRATAASCWSTYACAKNPVRSRSACAPNSFRSPVLKNGTPAFRVTPPRRCWLLPANCVLTRPRENVFLLAYEALAKPPSSVLKYGGSEIGPFLRNGRLWWAGASACEAHRNADESVARRRGWSPVRKLWPSGTSGPTAWRLDGRGSGGAGRHGPRKARPASPRGGGGNRNFVANVVASFVDNVHDKDWVVGGSP